MKSSLFFIVIVLGIGGYFGYQYYSETYASKDAYATIPTTIPEKVKTFDQDGKLVNGISEYNYKLTFVKNDGSEEIRDISISGEQPTPLEPNTFIKVKMSKKRITEGPNAVDKSSIPKKVLEKLSDLKD